MRSSSFWRSASRVEHLRLNRDVKRRNGLVADDQPRFQRESACHADPLALPAGELVRVAVVVLRVETDALHELTHERLAVAVDLVDGERRTDDLPDRVSRVERGVRVLEDDLDLAA